MFLLLVFVRRNCSLHGSGDLDPKANLQWLELNGRVKTGEFVQWEGAGEGNPSCPVVVMSGTGTVQEQGIGVHDVGAVALKDRTTSEDMFHACFAT